MSRQQRPQQSICWLGQSGYELSDESHTLLVDPWLSDHELRLFPPPAITGFREHIDAVLATHGHADHLDLAGLSLLWEQRPDFTVVVPVPLVDAVRERLPQTEVEGVQPGDSVTIGPWRVAAVPAWHGVTIDDGYSNGIDPATGLTPHVGYVIHGRAVAIYHAGDTLAHDEIAAMVRDERPDIALLPINGRDAAREAEGILGNLDATEAALFAESLGVTTVIPMHHDMVRGNTADAAELGAALSHRGEGIRMVTLERGRRVPVPGADRAWM